jgi:hypothetical protein
LSVDKSHIAELAPHKKKIITLSDTGVDIRLASTSITNPHCKQQIIPLPDTLHLKKLTAHTQQVVQPKTN